MTTKDDLAEIKKRFLYSSEKNYLQIILESYSQYNHRARLDIAKILYQKFIDLPDYRIHDNLKRVLFAELFNKLMQALEDSALLAIMFMDKNKSPLEHFLNNDNRVFVNFFRRAKMGLSDSQILRIYGLKSAHKLLKDGSIKSHELVSFQNEFDLMLHSEKGEKNRWKLLGKLYTERFINSSVGRTGFRKSSVVRGYHNIKHAYKTLLPTDLYKKIWSHNDKELTLSVIGDFKEFGRLRPRIRKELKPFANQKVIILGSFEVSKRSAEEIYERIYPQTHTSKLIADMQLNMLKDPLYPVRQIRFSIYQGKYSEPKHYEICPCGSGKKYKKCHRNMSNSYDGLVFRKTEAN